LNSFRFLQKAIDYEVERQITAIEAGEKIVQETRLWNEREAKTYSMRSKEEAHDYRYFPEPDLPPLCVDDAFVEQLRSQMPELPEARRQRFIHDYGLSFEDATQLTEARSLAEYFEATTRACGNPKAASNWILNELARELKHAGGEISASPVSSESLGEMIKLIEGGSISGKMAKDVLVEMYRSGKSANEVVQAMGGLQLSDETEIRALADKAVTDNPKQLEQYRAGKTTLFGFFVGQVIKMSGGRANPQLVNQVLKKALSDD
jgi:aspartyl-tRNA(Asn)/glutamyl-tRNA(Gln) amidotransferase subunit B